MKIAVLTNKNSLYGYKILNEFRFRKLKLEALVVVKQPFKYYLNLFNYIKKRVGIIEAVYFSAKKLSKMEKTPVKWRDTPFITDYQKFDCPVYYTIGTNSSTTYSILDDISPDILVLGQTGIVGRKVLSIPTLGTLNAHPAILPYYRGIDCARWAIFNEEYDKIGVSVHWVNEWIDMGEIITTRKYNIVPNETLDSLNENLYDLCAIILADVISSLTSNGLVLSVPQKSEIGKRYYKMPLGLEKITNNILSEYIKSLPSD